MPQAATDRHVLQKLVESTKSLYSLPTIAVDILKLTEQPKVDLHALKECIEQDPALTGKLLRVVNSSMFGLSQKVSDLNQALSLLGVKPLKLLVLGFSLPPILFDSVEAETLSFFWRFTLIKATAARELSHMLGISSEDEAFVAGLLQEIGSLVLIQQLGSSYVDFLKATRAQESDLRDLELETLGFDHAVLSARILEDWKLPPTIVDAVAIPHDRKTLAELSEESGRLPQILHLASLIATIIVDGRSDRSAELFATGEQYLGITAEQFADLMDNVQHRIDLVADLFSVPLNEEERYRDILMRAHQQLSAATADLLPTIVSEPDDSAFAERQHALSLAMKTLDHRQTETAATSRSRPASDVPVSQQTEYSAERKRSVTVRDDQRLAGHVAMMTGQGRMGHCDTSLVMLELHDFDRLLVHSGPEGASRLVDAMEEAIQSISGPQANCLLVADSRWAVMVLDCERSQAVESARLLLEQVPAWLIKSGRTNLAVDLRAGVATVGYPSRFFSPDQIIESAERCLFAAQAAGPQSVKSIDLV